MDDTKANVHPTVWPGMTDRLRVLETTDWMATDNPSRYWWAPGCAVQICTGRHQLINRWNWLELQPPDMVPTRRRVLRIGGAATVTALAGCSTDALLGSDDSAAEYTLTVAPIDASPTEHALYTPDDEALFGAPARSALDAILPDGQFTTYGYRSLPSDAYVAYQDSYYQTKTVVTGRQEMTRQLARVQRVPEEDVPDDAVLVDTLERPSARTLKILHDHAQGGGSGELLRGDAYVLRRPAERESRLATGDLADRVVTMTEDGTWAYRVRISRERVVETAHTAVAIEIADTPAEFRSVVFASRIDAELAPMGLPNGARELLDRAIARGDHTETAPVSEPFETVLDRLGLAAVERGANGRLLWYDDELYRYGLYIEPPDS